MWVTGEGRSREVKKREERRKMYSSIKIIKIENRENRELLFSRYILSRKLINFGDM